MSSSMKHVRPFVSDTAAGPGRDRAVPVTSTLEPSPERATMISPAELDKPRGFSHGWLVPAGAQVLFVAGQTAADGDGRVAERGLVAQFDVALRKALAVVAAAGGQPEHIVRMTVYVTDMDAYLASRKALGGMWRHLMGRHYPAMALVEVSRLVDPDAEVEVEVTAAIPGTGQETSR
jgi:enamine deaminase RidA (YjgF/YER057c/UK114 family)